MLHLNREDRSRPVVLTALRTLQESSRNKDMLIACYCMALGWIKYGISSAILPSNAALEVGGTPIYSSSSPHPSETRGSNHLGLTL